MVLSHIEAKKLAELLLIPNSLVYLKNRKAEKRVTAVSYDTRELVVIYPQHAM